jgi:hypothetical protein
MVSLSKDQTVTVWDLTKFQEKEKKQNQDSHHK